MSQFPRNFPQFSHNFSQLVLTTPPPNRNSPPLIKELTACLFCSQKTLPVAMAALSFLNEEQIGDAGLVAIPCIVGHLSQLFIDARIVASMRPSDVKPLESPLEPPSPLADNGAEAEEGAPKV